MEPIPHGGRLLHAQRRFPNAPTPWIDLSTGINPAAFPFTQPPPNAWQRLPEPESVQALEAAAALAYGVSDPAMVAAAPGTQALIQLLPRLLPQRRINIVSPTYAEHAAVWRAAGCDVQATTAPAGPATVLCNPNNPDGARMPAAALAALAETMDLLVVDEAFADLESGLGLGPYVPRKGLVVLRSFGKAYGLAGLRLGFALAEARVAAAIRGAMGPWAISGPAIAIGTQALQDTAWRIAAAATAAAAATRLDALVQGAGLRVLGGTRLFRLALAPDAAALAAQLGHAGILVRTFADHPGWVRFGLPPDEAAWARLAAGIINCS